MEDIMKMSIRSIICNVLVAGILLAALPMAAMEPQQPQAQAQQQQAPQTEKGSSFNPFAWVHDGISSVQEKIPDVSKGADALNNAADKELRNMAGTTWGPLFFALASAAIGLVVCQNIAQDKSDVSLLDRFLGLIKSLFGTKNFNERTERGQQANRENKSLDGVVNAVEKVNEAQEKLDDYKKWNKQQADVVDAVITEGKKKTSSLWQDIKSGAEWLSNSVSSLFGKTTESKNESAAPTTPATQQPEQQQTRQQRRQQQQNQQTESTEQTNNNNNNNSNNNEQTSVNEEDGILNSAFKKKQNKQSASQQTAAQSATR